MSPHKELVERYIEGFRRRDHGMILDCLTDDVVWDLYGYTSLAGKEAFDAEIANPEFTGRPTLTVDRLIEEGDAVAAFGVDAATRTDGATFLFSYCDVFTFAGHLIRRVESYVVPLPD
jgi:ketosteroid isomerase-like protein